MTLALCGTALAAAACTSSGTPLTLTFWHSKVVSDALARSDLDSRDVPLPATGDEKRRIDAECNADRGCADLAATAPH